MMMMSPDIFIESFPMSPTNLCRASFYHTYPSVPLDVPVAVSPQQAVTEAPAGGMTNSPCPSAAEAAASPLSTHLLPSNLPPFPFEAFTCYIVECLHRDQACIMGLGLPMWIFLIAFVMLAGEHAMHMCLSIHAELSI